MLIHNFPNEIFSKWLKLHTYYEQKKEASEHFHNNIHSLNKVTNTQYSSYRVRLIDFQASSNVPARKLIGRYTINEGHSVVHL